MLDALMLDNFVGVTLTLVLVGVFWSCLVLIVGQKQRHESDRREYSIELLERSVEQQQQIIKLLEGAADKSGGFGQRSVA